MAVCGDHLLELGEQCTDTALGVVGDLNGAVCQVECAAAACTPGTAQSAFTIALEPPPAGNVTSTTVFLAYRSDALSIPGSGLVSSVRQRITSLVSGATFFPNDRDYALRLVLSSSSVFPAPSIATVNFDVCTGAGAITTADLTCFVDSCAGAGGPIEGCTCSVIMP